MFPHVDWDYVFRFLNITLIDIALSGDNALVIGMAAASLPKAKRVLAIALGGGGAIVLRVLLTAAASALMLVPYLSAAGALALIWVVWRLFKLDGQAEREAGAEGGKKPAGLRQALFLILTADLMMSVDNVLAVAGSAHGDVSLLVAGLLISMPLLMATGGFVSVLIDKARWLVYVCGGAISFTAVRMFFEDSAVHVRVSLSNSLVLALAGAAAVALPVVFMLLQRRAAPEPIRVEGERDGS